MDKHARWIILLIQNRELEIKQIWYTLQTNAFWCAPRNVYQCIRNWIHNTFFDVNWYFHVSKQFSTWLNFQLVTIFTSGYRRCSYHDDMGFFSLQQWPWELPQVWELEHPKCESGGCHNCCSCHKHCDVHVNCMHLLLQRLMMLQKNC